MKTYVAYMRFHNPYFVDANELMLLVPGSKNIYEAIEHLDIMEYFSCKVDLLKHYQDEQIPIRWE